MKAVVPREQWLGMLPDYVVHAWDIQEQVIDVGNDFARVLQRVRMKGHGRGEDRSGIFVTSDIWRNQRGMESVAEALHSIVGRNASEGLASLTGNWDRCVGSV